MMIARACACIAVCAMYAASLAARDAAEWRDVLTPQKKKQEYRHVIALGIDHPLGGGSNSLSPLVAYYWFGENFSNPDLYAQLTFTTTQIYAIAGIKTDRIFAGVMPLVQHSTYGAWKSYNRGYDDERRSVGGNNVGAGGFFQYNILRILSVKASFHSSYHLYRLFLLTPNEHKYVNMPKRHWQIKPAAQIVLSDVEERELGRVKHGYMARVEYQYARRVGYGTWYDYDRLIFREKYNDIWAPPAGNTMGIWYRSRAKNTNRLYFNAAAYYAFSGDYNLLFDFYGGYFTGVDRNNAEHIGYFQQDHAIMPGYFDTEFYHHFYLISRVQLGIPIPFWGMRIQPGFNLLYMPKKNEVIGQGRGAITSWWLVRGYPRRFYTSVSCSFSLLLGNLLPLFIDYAYGIDAIRARSSHNVYLQRLTRGSHELQVLVVAAFGKNE
ncbi:MAG: hypothetical protein JW807_11855 [Spirochaetes bacterium]|nr:hypothetical protein [Spirochaetota bacterium]